MVDFPISKVYEDLSIYSPWNLTLNNVLNFIKQNSQAKSKVLDLMCGTGFLLNRIKIERPDLALYGFDSNKDFISFATKSYPNIEFSEKDVFNMVEDIKFDIIICTGGTHHLEDEKKMSFLNLIKKSLNPDGVAIIADPYIADFTNESERKLAAAELGYEYLLYAINKQANIEVIKECIEIMKNDILFIEYKSSISKFKPILEEVFSDIKFIKSWPENKSEFGDYYFICK
jgi:2-polyprenyl-3-methyl-5-hydroxy-6-metoxy-1,4-benzoquinol methylase